MGSPQGADLLSVGFPNKFNAKRMEGAASHLRYAFCFPVSSEAAQQLLPAVPSAADTSGICLPSTSPYTMASFQTCFPPKKIQTTSSFCICVHLPLPPC